MSLAYEQHLKRLEHRKYDVEAGQREVGRACEELERRKKALVEEEGWPVRYAKSVTQEAK